MRIDHRGLCEWLGLSRQPEWVFDFPRCSERAAQHVLSAKSAALRSTGCRLPVRQPGVSSSRFPVADSALHASALEKLRLCLRASSESDDRARTGGLLEV